MDTAPTSRYKKLPHAETVMLLLQLPTKDDLEKHTTLYGLIDEANTETGEIETVRVIL